MLPDTKNAVPLKRIQRWMYSVVAYPGDVHEALSSPVAASEISETSLGEVVKSSTTMTPTERIGVYHSMYILRMAEALQIDYPILAAYLGDHSFGKLVEDYTRVHPSESYTLDRFGDKLPSYLQGYRALENAPFLHDLARFEAAVTRVSNEKSSPVLNAGEIEDLSPRRLASAIIVPVKAHRILELDWDITLQNNAFAREKPLPAPVREKTRLVVFRRDWDVRTMKLEKVGYALIKAVSDGRTLQDALAVAISETDDPDPVMVFSLFRDWVSEGLFSRIEAPPLG